MIPNKIPQAPPLPPPLPSVNLLRVDQKKPNILPNYLNAKEEDMSVILQRLLSSLGDSYELFYMSNIDLKSQYQDGPKCGLVALSMASSVNSEPRDVEEIFEKSLSLHFTKQGEIFNAEHLACLAENYCGFNTRLLTGGLHSHFQCTVMNLLDKNLLLVPYDSDRNHYPCCNNGHTAHWAVITGIVVLAKKQQEVEENKIQTVFFESSKFSSKPCGCNRLALEKNCGGLHFLKKEGQIFLAESFGTREDISVKAAEGKIYLIARHGKSKHRGLWSFEDLSKSNDNLMHVSKDRNAEEFVLPAGGLTEGLKGKFIVLQV